MNPHKHKGVKIALIVVLVVVASILITSWCVFGTQLRAVGTIEKLEEHLYAMEYRGDYGFDGFLAQGGAESDGEMAGYDMHSSAGTVHHLSIADASGRSVAVEYIDGEMFVTETPILTNHYLTECEKQGVGSEQSHRRFDRLKEQYAQAKGVMPPEQVRECLKSVSQGTFPDSSEKTQWSIVYNTSALTADYCFRENFYKEYSTMLLDKGGWMYI